MDPVCPPASVIFPRKRISSLESHLLAVAVLRLAAPPEEAP